MNATKERQAWCCLQVKLCDPCLSALCVPWCEKALYKYSSFPFLYSQYSLCLPVSDDCAYQSTSHYQPTTKQSCVVLSEIRLAGQFILSVGGISFVSDEALIMRDCR